MIKIKETTKWLNECIKVFPKIKKHDIRCEYSKLPKNVLGRVKISYVEEKDIDAKALLLDGKRKIKIKRKTDDNFKIELSEKLKKIDNIELRRQVVQHTIIHELLHIEHNDFDTLSKDYKKRRKKKIHVKEFKEEVFKRFNQLRELNDIPMIENRDDLDLAINKIVSYVEGK